MGFLDKFKKNSFDDVKDTDSIKLTNLMQAKKYDEALDFHEKIFNKRDEGYWYTRGNILTNLNLQKESLECYLKAIELKNTYIKAWFRLGQKYFEFGYFRKACDAFVNVSKLEHNIGENEWNTVATFYYMMSLYLEYQNTKDEEIKNRIPNQIRKLRKVLDIDPNASDDVFLNHCDENFQSIVDEIEPKIIVEFRYPESKN